MISNAEIIRELDNLSISGQGRLFVLFRDLYEEYRESLEANKVLRKELKEIKAEYREMQDNMALLHGALTNFNGRREST